MSKERPILFKPDMVRAILDGRKIQTRRTQKLEKYNENPDRWALDSITGGTAWLKDLNAQYVNSVHPAYCPYGKPGYQLWVRENGLEHKSKHLFIHDATPGRYWTDEDGGRYGASYNTATITRKHQLSLGKWKVRPSIHMPRWASRILLEIISIRIERLMDISEQDAIHEGAQCRAMGSNSYGHPYPGWSMEDPHPQDYKFCLPSPKLAFANYINQIHGGKKWFSKPENKWLTTINPWVWVIEFKRIV